ncbi:MAG: YpdA family putative bacillithiol disulfide reductase [Candidatus Acidiferrales bacterium]
MSPSYDVICIGAGPTGLACAIEAKRAGMRPLVIDKGCLCNSLYHYPANLVFFTTAERMEIGDLPMTTAGSKPTRVEALKYYRKAAEHFGLETRLYETVEGREVRNGKFLIRTISASGERHEYPAKKLILATGYYDRPNLLGIAGEELPHVSHYFTDSHPFWEKDVVVIGAKNSAAEAALELFRAGARVTLVHRGRELGRTLKYWVRPDIENRIRAGEIQALFHARPIRIEQHQIVIRDGAGERAIPAFQIFAMTGYQPDFEFIERFGVCLDPDSRKPECDPETLESNVPGIYLAGVVVGGRHTSEIFIENGRFHGKQIIRAITGAGAPLGPAPVSPPGE